MPLVKTLLPFSVITFATGKFLIFVHLVIVHQVGRKASDFPGTFAEQRKPLVVYDWNSGTIPLQLPLSFVPVLNHSFLLGWVENWVPATLRPRLREIVCCPYLNSRAEHRLIKALGILLARPCCCKETPKGAVVSEEGARLGTAIPLVLPWASQEATAALAGEMLLHGSCWCWWAAVLAIAAGQALCYPALIFWIMNFCILHTLDICSPVMHYFRSCEHTVLLLFGFWILIHLPQWYFVEKWLRGDCIIWCPLTCSLLSLKCYQLWVCWSVALLTYSERGNNLLNPRALDQPLLLSISPRFSLIFLLAVPLCCSERGEALQAWPCLDLLLC